MVRALRVDCLKVCLRTMLILKKLMKITTMSRKAVELLYVSLLISQYGE